MLKLSVKKESEKDDTNFELRKFAVVYPVGIETLQGVDLNSFNAWNLRFRRIFGGINKKYLHTYLTVLYNSARICRLARNHFHYKESKTYLLAQKKYK